MDPALPPIRAQDAPVDTVALQQLDFVASVDEPDLGGPDFVGAVEQSDEPVADTAPLVLAGRHGSGRLEGQRRRILDIAERVCPAGLLQRRAAPARQQRLVDGLIRGPGDGLHALGGICPGPGPGLGLGRGVRLRRSLLLARLAARLIEHGRLPGSATESRFGQQRLPATRAARPVRPSYEARDCAVQSISNLRRALARHAPDNGTQRVCGQWYGRHGGHGPARPRRPGSPPACPRESGASDPLRPNLSPC